MRASYLIATISALALLGACSNTDLMQQTEQKSPTGSAFAKDSYTEYMKLAESEEMQKDHSSAKHYLTKADLSAEGKEVGPDDPKLRQIDNTEKKPIEAGYTKLKTALQNGAGERKPAEAAKAQAMLDCWMEQAEEGWQWDDIAACRTGFEKSVAMLGDTATSADKAMPPSGSPFTVNFQFDSVDLTPSSRAELKKILDKVSVYKPKSIRITAHTDLVGGERYNEALSQKRAAALKNELEGAGTASIIATGVGTSDPVVNTQKANVKNRRAVIIFQ
jgi:OOP family OmpA-OmpF porin